MSDSNRVIVDSSGWLEYLTDDVNADRFAPYIAGHFEILVPTVVIYEVYKKLLVESGKSAADAFASDAMRRVVIPLDDVLSISAAQMSLDHRLPMADAMIYASAVSRNAELVTGDLHFNGLPGVVIP